MTKRALLLPLLCLTACTERRSSVIARYQSPMDEMRESVKQIATALPRLTQPTPHGKLVPAPIAGGPESNTAVLTIEEALGPPNAAELNLAGQGELVSCLRWTGTAPMSGSALAERDREFAAVFERALKTPYLVIVRARIEQLGLDRGGYTGGDAQIDAFLVELPSGLIKAVVQTRVTAPAEIKYRPEPGETIPMAMRRVVLRLIWSEARGRLATALEMSTGGTFRF